MRLIRGNPNQPTMIVRLGRFLWRWTFCIIGRHRWTAIKVRADQQMQFGRDYLVICKYCPHVVSARSPRSIQIVERRRPKYEPKVPWK